MKLGTPEDEGALITQNTFTETRRFGGIWYLHQCTDVEFQTSVNFRYVNTVLHEGDCAMRSGCREIMKWLGDYIVWLKKINPS